MEEKAKTKLKKELKLFDVFAIAAGATLSAGFFLLPGIAAKQAGPAIVLAYLLAAIPLIPAMFSIVELGTAMPKAGGVYYFLDRTIGPLFGTIGGIGTWLALLLKVSFALVGMGAYIQLFIPELDIVPIAITLAIILGMIGFFGAKKSSKLQVFLLLGLLAILAVFLGGGVPQIAYVNFEGFFDAGSAAIISTTGLVYISYVGVTNVASLSEEVKNPEKNLPRGVIIAMSMAILIYVIGIGVLVGVLPMEELAGNLTPIAAAGEKFLGKPGMILLSIAALLAFVSVANAGTLSASRYPLAMSRDNMLPDCFQTLSKFGTPAWAILVTVGTIVLILLFLDPIGIAKLASAFQLLMFAFVCLAVIVIRESRIESYDPGFKSPFYPYMQILGILSPLYLITQMGLLPILFSGGLVLIGGLWYWFYARKRVIRTGAIYHIFERLGKLRYEGLDTELRGILKEKGLRSEDPFDEIITHAMVIDRSDTIDFEHIVEQAAAWFSQIIPRSSKEIRNKFLEGTKVGMTPVTRCVALPHFRAEGIKRSELVLVRSKPGISLTVNDIFTGEKVDKIVHAIFFLVSPDDNPPPPPPPPPPHSI